MARMMVACAALALFAGAATAQKGDTKVAPVLAFQMTAIDGKKIDLSKYQGKVVLIVNVASECGYTPQYETLQVLYKKYAKDGFVVLGVPCNDFGKQEPGTNEEIAKFCKGTYGVEFDMFAKVKVKPGPEQAPLYKYLTSKETNPKFAGPIRWNFEKFLIDRQGNVVDRFASNVDPSTPAFDTRIQEELKKK
jgi:glutathione peroxidase